MAPRQATLGVICIVAGLIVAAPLIAVAIWLASMGGGLILLAPSLTWMFWAIPSAGAVGALLAGYGVWTLVRERA